MYQIDVEKLADAQADGAVVVDVREPSEHATGHLPGAKLIPSHELRARLYEIPKDVPVYLLCATGARSLELITFMRAIGYDAWSVSGGMCAWHRSGR
jgi:rhodanese-related sulfurtransferase